MHPAFAVGVGFVLALVIISRPGVKAAIGGLMLPDGACPGCKGGAA